MSDNFTTCVNRVLAREGGYAPASPNDPGGETNFGIAKRYHPSLDIKNLTRAAAVQIYFDEYWKPIRGDELPLAVAFHLMDFAVNSGVSPAVKALQSALGVKPDGILGPVTMDKIWSISGIAAAALVMRFTASRLHYLTGLKNWLPNSAGWVNRVADNLVDSSTDLG